MITEQACFFCAKFHKPENCRIFPSVSARQNRLNEQRRCYRCLNTGHIAPDCRDFVRCGKCRSENHHLALCKQNTAYNHDDHKLNELCIFCYQHSNSSRCKVVTTHLDRVNHAKSLYRCPLCLECHPYMKCRIKMPLCMFCDMATHNKALCPKNLFLDENHTPDPKENTCVFCGDHAKSEDCKVVTILSLRIISLAAEGRCKRCLHLHEFKRCPLNKKCQICRSRDHHRVICPLDPALTSSCVASVPSSPSPSTGSICSVGMELEPTVCSTVEVEPTEPSNDLVPPLPSVANTPADDADHIKNLADEFKTQHCALKLPASASSSSGYPSDDSSEPELTPASSATSFDNTWQNADRMVRQINGNTETETRQNVPESKLHIWLGAKKRTPYPSQNSLDYTIDYLAWRIGGCGLPEAP